MRVLILGGTGMLGHKLCQVFAPRFDTYATVRSANGLRSRQPILAPNRIEENVTVQDMDSVIRALRRVSPAVVVNCVGIVKQSAAARDPVISLSVNSLFPHRLAAFCALAGARLIHISSDCVFSGRQGRYTESDLPDPEDLYGRTKLLGEVSDEHCLTLRTSMIGRELESCHGLLEWFLRQEGKCVRGYTRAIFSGLATPALAGVIAEIIARHPGLHGVWHVAGEAVSKFELLRLVQETYGLKIGIEADDSVVCDRSLSADRLRDVTGFRAPAWPEMISELYRESTLYA
jgi:dTDP-4-dehydrorhamnose reductase